MPRFAPLALSLDELLRRSPSFDSPASELVEETAWQCAGKIHTQRQSDDRSLSIRTKIAKEFLSRARLPSPIRPLSYSSPVSTPAHFGVMARD